MTVVSVQLLGPPRAYVVGDTVAFKSDKRYQCLGYLAFKGDWVARDELAYLFWPDVGTSDARHRLRQLVKRMRALPWKPAFETERDRIRWLTKTDTEALEDLIEHREYASLPGAYSGDLLEGLLGDESNEFTAWLEHTREHLSAAWRKALLQHSRELEAQGQSEQAGNVLESLLTRDPLDEEAVRALLRIGSRAGERERALDAYRTFRQRLERELELAPTSETEQLADALREAAPSGPIREATPVAVGDQSAASGTPGLTTSFIGRDLELGDLAHLLAKPDCRLITLTGFGGVGKSRLAQQAADELASRYADGSTFVNLEAIEDVQGLPSVVAGRLGLTLGGKTEPFEQLQQGLRDRHLLLVLDTFEHLAGGRDIVARLLAACPKLDVIVTSRGRLGLDAEWLLPLGGLSFPQDPETSLPDALSYDALRLFVARAERVRPTYSMTVTDLPHALKLCRLLDGSPLGLELAAVWLRAAPLPEIVSEIEANLDFLGRTGDPDGRPGLRATFEHSWKLLSPHEQMVLSRLSVFRGGFRKEAAATVASATLAVLAALVDKSLVRVSSEGRYYRHPLIHQFSREKLANEPESLIETEARHARTYLAFMEEEDENARDGVNDCRLSEDEENIRAALHWTRANGEVQMELRLVTSLAQLFHRQGNFQEGFSLLAPTLARTGAGSFPAVLAKAILAVSDLTLVLGNIQEVSALADQGLVMARKVGDKKTAAAALLRLGHAARMGGDSTAARKFYQQSSDVHRAYGDSPDLAVSLGALSVLAYEQGALAMAQTLAREALAVNRRLERTRGIAYCLGVLGSVALDRGDHVTATSNYEEELSIYRALDDPRNVAMALANLGIAFAAQGDPSRSRALQEESLTLRRRLGDKAGIAFVLGNLGGLALDRGELGQARALHEESLALRRELGDTFRIGDSLSGLGDVARYEGDPVGAQSLHEEGLRLRREIGDSFGIVSSLNALAQLRLDLGDAEVAREELHEALTQGKELGFKKLVAKSLEACARLAMAEHAPTRAAQIWGAAEALRRAINNPAKTLEQGRNAREQAVVEQELGASTFAAAWAEGAALTLNEVVALAL